MSQVARALRRRQYKFTTIDLLKCRRHTTTPSTTMKLLLAVLPALAHSQLSCPDPLAHVYPVNDDLKMYFDLVLSDPNVTEGSILCARFESNTTGWIGWGISPTKGMEGAEAVIGVPADGTVKKYILYGKDVSMVTAMEDKDQTLMDASITQDEEGRTTMSFTKYLFEDKYGIIPNDFINSFIWATGTSNELSYHGATRGNFGMNLLTTLPPSSAPPTVAVDTVAPSVAAGNESLAESGAPSMAAGTVSLAPSVAATTSSGATEGTAGGVSPSPSIAVTTSSGATEGTGGATPVPSITATTSSAATEGNDSVSSTVAVSTAPTMINVGASGSPVVESQTTAAPVVADLLSEPPASSTTESTAAAAAETTAAASDSPSTSAPVLNATQDETDDGMGDDAAKGVDFSVDGSEEDKSSASVKTAGMVLGFALVLSVIGL